MRVWKSGRSVAETRTRSVCWVYMTYRDLVAAALSWWWLISDMRLLAPDPPTVAAPVWGGAIKRPYTHSLGMEVGRAQRDGGSEFRQRCIGRQLVALSPLERSSEEIRL